MVDCDVLVLLDDGALTAIDVEHDSCPSMFQCVIECMLKVRQEGARDRDIPRKLAESTDVLEAVGVAGSC